MSHFRDEGGQELAGGAKLLSDRVGFGLGPEACAQTTTRGPLTRSHTAQVVCSLTSRRVSLAGARGSGVSPHPYPPAGHVASQFLLCEKVVIFMATEQIELWLHFTASAASLTNP